MPAHLRDVPVWVCDYSSSCGRRATKILVNGYNAEVGHYCGQHAAKGLKEFQDRYEKEGQ